MIEKYPESLNRFNIPNVSRFRIALRRIERLRELRRRVNTASRETSALDAVVRKKLERLKK